MSTRATGRAACMRDRTFATKAMMAMMALATLTTLAALTRRSLWAALLLGSCASDSVDAHLLARADAGERKMDAMTDDEAPLLEGQTVVSITFDDGVRNQYQAGALLRARGMRGTFYVNSGRLLADAFMSQGELLLLQQQGHEIGGHTVSHANLPTLDEAEQRRQICKDRSALLHHGLRVTSFAYPYDGHTPALEAIVHECGYNSARGVGSLAAPGTCHGCPSAEPLPPPRLYHVRTPPSIKTDTTLQTMQAYVQNAEAVGGGYVPLVFHHVCDGCDPNAVSVEQLTAFLDWLALRRERGTVVRTVGAVLGGPLRPGVEGPPPRLHAPSSELLPNADLQGDDNADGVPNCFQQGGFGDNDFVWTRSESPLDGSVAHSVEITRWVSGGRRLLSRQDLGSCAPGAHAEHAYVATADLAARGPVRFSAYVRNALGGWDFFAQSELLDSSQARAQRSFRTPALPAGADALSVGVSLYGPGMLTIHGLSLRDADQTPPQVALLQPSDQAQVHGSLRLQAAASDPGGIQRVEFVAGDELLGSDETAPFSFDWDCRALAGQGVEIVARAFDLAGNVARSRPHAVQVTELPAQDEQPPVVSLSRPLPNASYASDVELVADATDDLALARVELLVNGTRVASVEQPPFRARWDVSQLPEGPAALSAVAVDASGQRASSEPVAIRIDRSVLVSCNGRPCVDGYYDRPVAIVLRTKAGDTAEDATENATDTESTLLRYTLDGSDPGGAAGRTYAGPFPVDRTTTLRAQASNALGLHGALLAQHVRIDLHAPTDVSVLAPRPGARVSGTATIEAGARDDVGVTRVRFYLDDVQLGTRVKSPFRWKWNTTGVTPGTHTLAVQAEDAAGNATRSAMIQVHVP